MNALKRHFDQILELVFVMNLKLRIVNNFLARFERYLHNQINIGY